MQFEMLTNLVHEIKEVNAQLNQFMADFAAKQELAGGVVNISQSLCSICGQMALSICKTTIPREV